MSLIQCTAPCVYQQEGQCTLVRAASPGPPNEHGCLNFVPQFPSKQGGQRLSDIADPDLVAGSYRVDNGIVAERFALEAEAEAEVETTLHRVALAGQQSQRQQQQGR